MADIPPSQGGDASFRPVPNPIGAGRSVLPSLQAGLPMAHNPAEPAYPITSFTNLIIESQCADTTLVESVLPDTWAGTVSYTHLTLPTTSRV